MSYCRFSDKNWQSDVYCYQHVDGNYQVHVAGVRLVLGVTPLDRSSIERLKETHAQQLRDVEKAEFEPIGLEHDDQMYTLADAEECYQMLRQLEDAGYNVPDHALEALAEEAGV